jgi:hypothetical protein
LVNPASENSASLIGLASVFRKLCSIEADLILGVHAVIMF